MRVEQVVTGLLLYVLLSGQSVTSYVTKHKKNNNSPDYPDLYSDNDLVHVLNMSNFESSVHDGKRAWIVNFYDNSCSLCRNFAKFWKAFAKDVYGWKDIVAVGVIDCTNDNNYPLCKKYDISKSSTITFFHARPISIQFRIVLKKLHNENYLRRKLIYQLVRDLYSQEAGPNWPNLIPYSNGEIEPLWKVVPKSVDYQFLIFEEPNAYLGAEVILDLHKLENTRIRRLTMNNFNLYSLFKIEKLPTIVVIERNGKYDHLKTEILTRKEIAKKITGFLKLKRMSTEINKDKFNKSHVDHLSKENKTKEKHFTRDRLYLLDLETAVRYSLNNEIPMTLNNFGEKQTALKTYLTVIAKYLPRHLPNMKTYLEALQEVIEAKSNMTGQEFKKQVNQKEKELAPIYSASKTWIGCKGSDSTLRGYSCGLWIMFHTLTVIAAEMETKEGKDDTPSVLQAMHDYIKNFFICGECAQHFQEISDRRKLSEPRSRDGEVLWLWEAHNEVNKRIASGRIKDPKYEKVQYPSVEFCPDCCLPDGKWNEYEVLKYLKAKYSKENIEILENTIEKQFQIKIELIYYFAVLFVIAFCFMVPFYILLIYINNTFNK